MKNKNIIEKNAKIPDIVQQKANAAFTTIYTRQDEPDEKPQKTHKSARATIIKIASAVVAAAITIAVLFVGLSYFGGQESELPVVGNQFTIRVCAAELEPNASLPISMDVSNQSFGYGADWTGGATFELNFPISVEGEDISSVTFKVDNAVFEVVSIDCPSIVKSGSPKTLDDYRSTYVNGCDWSGQPIGKTEVGYYDSFSADYGTLQNSNYLFNICNVLTDRMDIYYLLTYEGNDDDSCAAVTYMVKDVKVTIEVTFNDGTTASRSLGLFANQYLATDKMEDGTEYTYTTTQIFCYDENEVDDTTKQLINSQIAHATEISTTAAANNPIDTTTIFDDETVDYTDTSADTETPIDTDTSADTDSSVDADTPVDTDTSVSTEGAETTDEVSPTETTGEVNSTENTEYVSSDDNAGTSEDI